jgi:CRP-like cAMP-binding protein
MTTPHQKPFAELEDLGGASDFVQEIQEILKTQSIFEGFSAQESALLCEYMECYGAPSRTTVLSEGDRGDFLIIILTGHINVVKSDESGDSKAIAQVGPGDFLGEMALFDDQPRFASCITTEPADFAVLTRSALNDILIDHPRLGNKLLLTLLQRMTERLRDAVTRMLPNTPGSVI